MDRWMDNINVRWAAEDVSCLLLTARGGRDCVAIREKGKKERQKEGKEKKSNAEEAKMGRAEMDGGIRSTDRRLE